MWYGIYFIAWTKSCAFVHFSYFFTFLLFVLRLLVRSIFFDFFFVLYISFFSCSFYLTASRPIFLQSPSIFSFTFFLQQSCNHEFENLKNSSIGCPLFLVQAPGRWKFKICERDWYHLTYKDGCCENEYVQFSSFWENKVQMLSFSYGFFRISNMGSTFSFMRASLER